MQLIINADDFGWDEDANSAIIALCEAQKLQGVSIMANFAEEKWLKQLAPFQTDIRLGIHVVLNEGKPISAIQAVHSLVNDTGHFYSSAQLFQRYLLGKIKKEHVWREVRAQIDRLRGVGILVHHADSHQHIHHLPFLGKVILEGLEKMDIRSVRNSLPYEKNDLRRKILYLFSCLSQAHLIPFSHNQQLLTFLASTTNPSKELLLRSLQNLRTSNFESVELMCHPAMKDRTGCYLQRKQEYDFLRELQLEGFISRQSKTKH